jgi:tRNA-specific 2-thiouridylase
MFTIGQRKGLPGGSAQPRYVVDLDPETNRVIVGQAEDLLVEEFEIDRVNWISGAGNDDPSPRSATAHTMAREITVKIRYNHPGTRATVMPMESQRARIRLHDSQKAVTPGQAAVFYDDDLVLGGGWICRQAELVAA